MNNLNCFAILQIPHGRKFVREFLDLNFTNTSNEEGIVEYIKNVHKIDTFEVHWTIFDEDHFKELHQLT